MIDWITLYEEDDFNMASSWTATIECKLYKETAHVRGTVSGVGEKSSIIKIISKRQADELYRAIDDVGTMTNGISDSVYFWPSVFAAISEIDRSLSIGQKSVAGY